MKSTRGDEELFDGAVYASLKTQAHSLHKMSGYKDALSVYNNVCMHWDLFVSYSK